MNHELVIEGKVFFNDRFEQCCIGINDGKITEIKKILNGEKTKHFSKQLILPAGIDVHVHFRDPGMKHKETFETGSKAALFGGISTVFDMPNTVPPTTTLARLKEKNEYAAHHSFVDFGLYAGVTPQNISVLPSFSSWCSGYKVFLGDTTGSFAIDSTLLPQVLEQLKTTKKPVFFHAEDNTCLQRNRAIEHNPIDHHRHRPPHCEEQAIQTIMEQSKNTQIPIHICHLSTQQGLTLLQKRLDYITCGVTPHHLLFSLDQIKQPASWYKVNPPIRPKEHSAALFQAIKQEEIDILESDHAPHTLEEKQQPFDEAPSGIPGVETMMPLFLSLVKKQYLSFQTLLRMVCKNPADLLHLSKGDIQVGNDADFMIVDLRNEKRLIIDYLHSKAEWSPFEGRPVIFPSHVFIRGKQMIKDSELSLSKPVGRSVINE